MLFLFIANKITNCYNLKGNKNKRARTDQKKEWVPNGFVIRDEITSNRALEKILKEIGHPAADTNCLTLKKGTKSNLVIRYEGERKSPSRCSRCHIPKVEGFFGYKHVCWVDVPCLSLVSCLGDHAKSKFLQLLVFILE